MGNRRRVKQPIKNFLQGISQQPDQIRSQEQLEYQLNMLSDPVSGLVRRNPFKYVRDLDELDGLEYSVHTVDRDANAKYWLAVGNGWVKAYDFNGNALASFSTAYFSSTSPSTSFRFVDLPDRTLILNTQQTVQASTNTYEDMANTYRNELIVKQGVYGRTYRVYIVYIPTGLKTLIATHALPDGSGASDATTLDTTTISADLHTQIDTWATNNPLNGISNVIRRGGNFIAIALKSENYRIEVEDGYNSAAVTAVGYTVNDIGELPAEAFNDTIKKVLPQASSEEDAYFVQFKEDEGWQEVRSPEESDLLDVGSLPRAVIYDNGNFTFDDLTWDQRAVGSDETNPPLSIMGKTIRDIFFFRDRLCLMTENSIVMSRTSDYYNLFPKSARTTFDDDPIDVTAGSNEVPDMRYAIPQLDSVWIKGGSYLYRLGSGDDIMTPSTVQLTSAGKVSGVSSCRPAILNNDILIGESTGDYSQVTSISLTPDARGITNTALLTGHVPHFIKGPISKISAFSTSGMAVVQTEDYPEFLYIYQTQKDHQGSPIQTAWHLWSTGNPEDLAKVHHVMSINDETLYFIIKRNGFTYLEKMDITSKPNVDDTIGDTTRFTVYLDGLQHRRNSGATPFIYSEHIEDASLGLAGNVSDDYRLQNLSGEFTVISCLPTELRASAVIVPKTLEGDQYEGFGWSPTNNPLLKGWEGCYNSDTHVAIPGDWRDYSIYIGEEYPSSVQLSNIYHRDREGKASIASNEFTVDALLLQCGDSGKIDTTVNLGYRRGREFPLTARETGVVTPLTIVPFIADGLRRLPIRSKGSQTSITLSAYKWYPMSLISGEYIGNVYVST